MQRVVPVVAPPADGGGPRPPAPLTRAAAIMSPLILAHLALLAIPFMTVTAWDLVMTFLVTRLSGLGVTVGLHRYFSHRAFKTSRVVQFLLACAGCTALQRGPLWWAYHHRLHHRHADTPLDVHSPVVGGFWHAHLGWLFARVGVPADRRAVRDLAKFPELVWLERAWLTPPLLLAAGCYAAGGWAGVVVWYCLGVVAVVQVTLAVNSVGHLAGGRRFATGEGSRNNLVLGYLAMGDGWHNNHHHAPGSARHGLAWYEFDLSYLAIRVLAAAGLAWDVRIPPPGLLAGAGAADAGVGSRPGSGCDP